MLAEGGQCFLQLRSSGMTSWATGDVPSEMFVCIFGCIAGLLYSPHNCLCRLSDQMGGSLPVVYPLFSVILLLEKNENPWGLYGLGCFVTPRSLSIGICASV